MFCFFLLEWVLVGSNTYLGFKMHCHKSFHKKLRSKRLLILVSWRTLQLCRLSHGTGNGFCSSKCMFFYLYVPFIIIIKQVITTAFNKSLSPQRQLSKVKWSFHNFCPLKKFNISSTIIKMCAWTLIHPLKRPGLTLNACMKGQQLNQFHNVRQLVINQSARHSFLPQACSKSLTVGFCL